MDEQSIITQCPNCSTQFRVTAGQLKVAKGQVRCGACLNVFDATTHQVIPENPTVTPAPQHAPIRVSNNQHKQANQTQHKAARKIHNPVTAAPAKEKAPQQTKPSKPEVTSPPPKTEETSKTVSTLDTPSSKALDSNTVNNDSIPTLEFKAEPLTLHTQRNSHPVFQTGWFLACLVTVVGLFCQYLWFNRAELYWDRNYQPLYTTVCNYLDCQIPPPQNLEKILNQQLQVTPHKKYADAVEVTLMLLNTADFAQPYPALRLVFSDLKGRTIAQRDLEPVEYLDNETIDLLSMPSQQPIQISLELMSPGHRAMSYQLELLAPSP
ncbi:DUF3426 domain-containing protein [Neptuniibacter sp.]|uniref:DUF3426 domain-containing protein n=1 Tax=Neptuniibacter sp. TaxID=1962643 RepID=UPI00261605E3|nr:DUF3426 domain-containing protein [Neptuniibacter sp.]MCP4598295.1 DUF3426 domain-containing protein [Neptuniibacter sp.]